MVTAKFGPVSELNTTATRLRLGSLLEHSQPLAAHRRLEGLEARDIATRTRKTGHKSGLDRIADLDEDDWDRAGEPVKLDQGWSGRGHNHIGR